MVVESSMLEDNSESAGQGGYNILQQTDTRRLWENMVAACTCTAVLRTRGRAGRVGYVDYAADSVSPAEDAIPSKASWFVPFSPEGICYVYWLHGFPLQRVHWLRQS